jgi:NitT/TauT family transport system substrate-binding protein
MTPRPIRSSRREFLAATMLGTSALLNLDPVPAGSESPPETTRIGINRIEGICVAPQYVAEELLRAEGFSDVNYVPMTIAEVSRAVALGEVDVCLHLVGPAAIQVDRGDPITLLGGVHTGCFELFGGDRVRAIRDLKEKTIAITGLGLTQHVFFASMVAYVGMDPRRDVTFIAHSSADGKRLLAEGKVDAYLGFPPRSAGTA